MRQILPGDLDYAVRVLLALPQDARPAAVLRLLEEAEEADFHRLSKGRAHPAFGTGSVMAAAARREMARLPPYCDAEYCGALALVLAGLADWRAQNETGQELRHDDA